MQIAQLPPKKNPRNRYGQSGFVLTINGGSSSIKFALFSSGSPLKRLFGGQVERIGTPGTLLTATRDNSSTLDEHPIAASNFQDGIQVVLAYLLQRIGTSVIIAIGHRIVKGGVHLVDNQLITPEVIAELRRMQPLDLDHLPREIALIDAFGKAFPKVPQIACFDTAFHKDIPRIAQLLPIPRHYLDAGVRRFGFHGLSYTYLMNQLAVVAGEGAANGRLILAHLGSGAEHGGSALRQADRYDDGIHANVRPDDGHPPRRS